MNKKNMSEEDWKLALKFLKKNSKKLGEVCETFQTSPTPRERAGAIKKLSYIEGDLNNLRFLIEGSERITI